MEPTSQAIPSKRRLKTLKAFDCIPGQLQAKDLDLKNTKKVSSIGFGKLAVESNGISWCFRNVNNKNIESERSVVSKLSGSRG